MPKKVINPIEPLRKSIAKLQLQLMKAHQKKVATFERAVVSTTSKLKKKQEQLTSLKNKKPTAATQRRQKNLRSDIVLTKDELKTLKLNLSHAKAAYTKAKLLERAEAQAIKLTQRPKQKLKKKTLRKKAIKKIIKTADSIQELLTPDLTVPVNEAVEKPKKLWKPKVEKTEDKKILPTTLEAEPEITHEATPETQEPELSHSLSTIKMATSQESEQSNKEENIDKPIEVTKEAPLPSAETSNDSNSDAINETIKEETQENIEDTQKSAITNWHTMPIVKTDNE